MGVAYTSMALAMDFGAGFVDVLADVRAAGYDIQLFYGINGSGPTDRVAGTGTLRFALENSPANSAGLTGYYSPNHANKRTGFGLGIPVRLSVVSGGVTYYKFLGTLDVIEPAPGKVGKVALCTAVDWMSEAGRYQIQGVQTLLGTDADAVLTAVVGAVPKAPNATSYGNGSDAYAFAPAAGPSERYTAASEFQRIAMSELGFIVMRGGTTIGTAGTLAFISRAQLVASPYNVSQVTLDNTMFRMSARVSRDSVRNVFKSTTHPRSYDSTANDRVVLYAMPNSVPIEGGAASRTLLGQYRDPAQKASRVSGYGMMGAAGQPAMVLGTDYYFTSNPDGTGTDLSGSLTFTPTPGAQDVRYVVSSSVTGYFWAQARGYGIYDYSPETTEKRDTTSVTAYGESPADLDLYYQSDGSFGQNAGAYLLPYYKDPTTIVPSVTFLANYSSTLMLHGLAREPIDAVTIQEATTGVNKLHRIMSVGMTFRHKLIEVTWGLSPIVDVADYWFLEEGGSQLGVNTTLAL
jgi:hypothetical protein